jgi:hypothetical protein
MKLLCRCHETWGVIAGKLFEIFKRNWFLHSFVLALAVINYICGRLLQVFGSLRCLASHVMLHGNAYGIRFHITLGKGLAPVASP